MSLTPKQQLFVAEYLVDLNATQAAVRAGYSEKTAYSVGHENLKKPEVAAAIQEAMDRFVEQERTTAGDTFCCAGHSHMLYVKLRNAVRTVTTD